MKLWDRIKFFFDEKDVFHCANCKKKSKGRWCLTPACEYKPVRGWYYDEYGHQNKPSAVIRHLKK